MQLAVADLFRAKWTADIHREWMEALLASEPHRDRARLERTRDLMDRSTRDCLVTGYEGLIPALELPDPDEGHVLAAAIVSRCDVIVIQNLKDFPGAALEPYGIDVQHPDEFLCNHLNLAQGLFRGARRSRPPDEGPARRQRARRKRTWLGGVIPFQHGPGGMGTFP